MKPIQSQSRSDGNKGRAAAVTTSLSPPCRMITPVGSQPGHCVPAGSTATSSRILSSRLGRMTPAEERTHSALGRPTPSEAASVPAEGKAIPAVGMTIFTIRSNTPPLCRPQVTKRSAADKTDHQPPRRQPDNQGQAPPTSLRVTKLGASPPAGELMS